MISTLEKDFILEAIQQHSRIDGRKPHAPRGIKFEFGLKPGIVQVQLGRTRCLAGVTCTLITPKPERNNEGSIKFFVNFPTYTNKTRDQIDRITHTIERGIRESQTIDMESLCVLAGEKVWQLTIEVSITEDAGNVLDCANLAAIAALRHHRRPDVTVIGSSITVHSMLERHPVALTIRHMPICVSIGHMILPHDKTKSDPHIYTIIDPNYKEELCLCGSTIFSITKHRKICSISKMGGVPLSMKQILEFGDLAYQIACEWTIELNEKIKEAHIDDLRKRKQMLHAHVKNPIDIFGSNIFKTDDNKNENNIKLNDDPILEDDESNWKNWILQQTEKIQNLQYQEIQQQEINKREDQQEILNEQHVSTTNSQVMDIH